jgi:nucleotide-binding universal stress UspA family protein
MPHYLVVAHDVASPEDLASCLSGLLADDPNAAYSLLVTATHPLRALKGQTRELEALARKRAAAAREQLEASGIYLARSIVGDGSPVVAVEDELRVRPEVYDAIVLCTGRPGLRSWVFGDTRTQIEEKARLPVFHTFVGATDALKRARKPRIPRLAQWWERTRLAPTEPETGSVAPTRRQLIPMACLMAAYLLGGLVLAVTVSPGFLLNDAVALVVYTVVLGGLLAVLRMES